LIGSLQGSFANGNSSISIPAANGNLNLSAGGNVTLVVTSTGANITGYANITGNISAANVTANLFGNGSGLSSIVGANVTGAVANATYATSAGTATSATTATTATSATTAGTVTANNQPNITGVGTLTSGTWTANVIGASYIATLNQNTTGYAATVSGAAQGNITSVGTLTGLTVGGNAQISSLGVGTAAVGTAGEIVATNNIIAYYSDGRLKTVSSTIPNALDKVSKLTGVYYTTNELAESFGYTDKANQVGVIAQEVEAVLPEVVTLAPFDRVNVDGEIVSKSGENYKTVFYDKLVPLLIEAIKELKEEVDMLKSNKQ
jgi:hypothetical protein